MATPAGRPRMASWVSTAAPNSSDTLAPMTHGWCWPMTFSRNVGTSEVNSPTRANVVKPPSAAAMNVPRPAPGKPGDGRLTIITGDVRAPRSR